MGTPVESVTETRADNSLIEAAAQIQAAADAKKCWACGCLRHALDAIDRAISEPSRPGALRKQWPAPRRASCHSDTNVSAAKCAIPQWRWMHSAPLAVAPSMRRCVRLSLSKRVRDGRLCKDRIACCATALRSRSAPSTARSLLMRLRQLNRGDRDCWHAVNRESRHRAPYQQRSRQSLHTFRGGMRCRQSEDDRAPARPIAGRSGA